jgi:hypothetical protein
LCGNASGTSSAEGSSRGIGPGSRVIPMCAPLWPTPTRQDAAGSRNATARRFTDAKYAKGVTLTDALILSGDMPLPTKAQMPDWSVPCPCRCHTSMSSAAASPARTSASPAEAKGSTGNARVFGQSTPDSFATYDPATSSWRTSQLSLLEEWSVFSGTWPRAGMTRNGTASRLRPLVPLTGATGSGLWPTPNGADGQGGRISSDETILRGTRPSGAKVQVTLREAIRRQELESWPTPTARLGAQRGAQAKRYHDPARSNDLDDAVAARGTAGQLNPTWVEWLMGFPLGWSDLEPSGMPSSRRSPNGSAGASSKPKG